MRWTTLPFDEPQHDEVAGVAVGDVDARAGDDRRAVDAGATSAQCRSSVPTRSARTWSSPRQGISTVRPDDGGAAEGVAAGEVRDRRADPAEVLAQQVDDAALAGDHDPVERRDRERATTSRGRGRGGCRPATCAGANTESRCSFFGAQLGHRVALVPAAVQLGAVAAGDVHVAVAAEHRARAAPTCPASRAVGTA